MQTFNARFTRGLTHADMKQHIAHIVEVPPKTRSLKISLAYAPESVENIHNLLTLTVLDPGGFRGAAHRHHPNLDIAIEEAYASPGFIPGPIQPGAWTVIVDTHMIMPDADLYMQLEISGSDEVLLPEAPDWQPGQTAPRGPGWYRGDLHAHTIHSDASWDVPDLAAYARHAGLDFITLSDHNTVSGLAQMDSLRGDDLLTLGGVELTTFWGHALALGRRDWVDWRVTPGQGGMPRIAEDVMAAGGTFIIAHPEAIGDPYCTGCHWGFDDMLPGPARVVGVWNTDWDSYSYNEAGLRLAYTWMNRGLRMALTSGSDHHGGQMDGLAFNMVYAQELNEDEILKAIRAGRLYISVGPMLKLEAAAAGKRAMMGDALRTSAGEALQIQAAWAGCPPGARVELVVDGEVYAQMEAGEQAEQDWTLTGGQAHWALITLRAENGDMLALTNPVYLDGREL